MKASNKKNHVSSPLTGSSGFESRLGHYCKSGVGIESAYVGSLWFKVQYGGWLGRLKHVEWVSWH